MFESDESPTLSKEGLSLLFELVKIRVLFGANGFLVEFGEFCVLLGVMFSFKRFCTNESLAKLSLFLFEEAGVMLSTRGVTIGSSMFG